MSVDENCKDPSDCCGNDPCTKEEPTQDKGGCCGGGSCGV